LDGIAVSGKMGDVGAMRIFYHKKKKNTRHEHGN
jgi:uncharacterized membrane protein YsdA (DUF1294 family)